MTSEQRTLVGELGQRAREIAHQREERDEAWADVRAANAEVLGAVLEAIRPAARSLGGQVPISCTVTPEGTSTESAPWRGLWLCGMGPAVTQKAGDVGRYGGSRYYLRDAGDLMILEYTGKWSTANGEASHWDASARVVSPTEVLAESALEPILDVLAKALEAQLGGASAKRAVQLKEKAERLRALSTLLRSWK